MKLEIKKYITFLVAIWSVSLFFTSCEQVIDLDLDTQEKQIVVDAYIYWEKGQNKAFPIVKLTYSMPFFSENSPEKISNAIVKLKTSSNQEYQLIEATQLTQSFTGIPTDPKGFYIYEQGITPVLGEEYTISIESNGKHYISKAKMKEVPQINLNRVIQKENAGIFKDQIELKFFFDAAPNEETAFFVVSKGSRDKRESYFSLDSQLLSNGKYFFTLTGLDEKYQKGDVVDIVLYRISLEYKQIIDLLIRNATNTGTRGRGGIFTIPNRIYGNVINTENPKENPLGAFRVSQYTKVSYTIK